MALLLKDAIQPNLVQTLEGNPAIPRGPFRQYPWELTQSWRLKQMAQSQRLCCYRSRILRSWR
ncbi:MAG: hypothetical protein R2778_09305 [Saprospiraceae bacterium]